MLLTVAGQLVILTQFPINPIWNGNLYCLIRCIEKNLRVQISAFAGKRKGAPNGCALLNIMLIQLCFTAFAAHQVGDHFF